MASSIQTIQYYEVLAPAPQNTFKGTLVGGVFATRKCRRVSIELHRFSNHHSGEPESHAEQCFIRLLKRNKSTLKKSFAARNKRLDSGLEEHKRAQQPMALSEHEEEDSDNESQSTATVAHSTSNALPSPRRRIEDVMVNASFHHLDPIDVHGKPLTLPASPHLAPLEEGRVLTTERVPLVTATSMNSAPPTWKTQYKIPLSEFHVMQIKEDSLTISFTCGSKRQTRVFVFSSAEEAQAFGRKIVSQGRSMKQSQEEHLKRMLEGVNFNMDLTLFKEKPLEFLVEVVGAENLARSDFIGSSDPFVKVYFGDKLIHKTKHIYNNVNPVWTIQTKSLFVWSTTGGQLFHPYRRLTFVVYDFDAIKLKPGKDECLGMVTLSPQAIYKACEERMELTLVPKEDECEIPTSGKLALRIRKASPSDLEFMSSHSYKMKQKDNAVLKSLKIGGKNAHTTRSLGENGSDAPPSSTSAIKSVMDVKKKKMVKEGDVKIAKYKVRPMADPRNKERTWMSKLELEQEYLKPSRNYKHIGSGNIGKLWLEVLGCSHLPNTDVGGFLGNKTDAFVTIVYEDCVAKTNVIDDTLYPKWMPWTDRAFCLNMMYPSSPLFFGVHDYDDGILGCHDLVGKATLDLCKFVPDTEYTLDLQLWDTFETTTRARMGAIKIRVRLEIEDRRKFLLRSLKVPPAMYVNSESQKDHECIERACRGGYDVEVYQLGTIMSLYDELYAYLRVGHYIKEGLKIIILWRGTYPVMVRLPLSMRGVGGQEDTESSDEGIEAKTSFLEKYTYEREICLPVTSMSAFVTGVCLVENPSLCPSVFFLLLGRLMVATMQWKSSQPGRK